ncbi:hypothetical protein VCR20J5_1240352 [Vibrio crassostreae]|nr:hypothetical protein VCR20J5_1240352 [Vibrio crassostreae]CDT34397.1 hypothetical protein VCR15J5_570035 [Vibrio crassostreae]
MVGTKLKIRHWDKRHYQQHHPRCHYTLNNIQLHCREAMSKLSINPCRTRPHNRSTNGRQFTYIHPCLSFIFCCYDYGYGYAHRLNRNCHHVSLNTNKEAEITSSNTIEFYKIHPCFESHKKRQHIISNW